MAGQRQVDYTPLEFQPGLFTRRSARQSGNRWRDGDNVRWIGGLAEKMGGFVERVVKDPDGNVATYYGKARSIHEWDSLDGQNWIAFGTQCKLYVLNNDVLYDITPQRRQAYINNGISTTSGSPIVTINDPNHDAQAGDHFTIEGGSAVGGITLGGEYTITDVLDQDRFTITVTTNASSTATGGGTATLRYDISCGLESDGLLYGYGVGDYGEEEYGTPRSTSTFKGFARVWSLDNWGEDLMASPNGGSLYVWRKNTGPQSKATRVPNAPENIEHMLVGPDGRHVLALGTNLASTGQQDRMFMRWTEGDDYDAWIISETNDAGSKRLDTGSRLITAVKTNRQILLFTDKAVYTTSLVGGNDVYETVIAARAPTIISKNAGVDVDGIVYFMAQDDFYYFDGTLRPLNCDILDKVFGTPTTPGINRAMQSKVAVRLVREFNEIWWSYPSGNSVENNATAVYNYLDKSWTFSSTPRECGIDKSAFYEFPVALSAGKVYLHETGADADTLPLPSYLESWEWEVLAGSMALEISRLQGDFPIITGDLTVTLFGRNRDKATRDTGPARVFNSANRERTPKFKKQQLGFRIENATLGTRWRMDMWRAKLIPHGRPS